MKILDIPQSGKRGLNVSQNGRYGQISRSLVSPTNPRSPAQQTARGIFATVTAAWRGLTESSRIAWSAAAKTYQSRIRCGTSGPLTGSQLYTKLNATAATFGFDPIPAPPAKPAFPTLAPVAFVITNTQGVIAIKLTCPTSPSENTVVRAMAPVSQGREVPGNFYILGMCPTPVTGASDITGLYTAKFGVPPVGEKVFVQCYQVIDGHESIPTGWSAIVPAA